MKIHERYHFAIKLLLIIFVVIIALISRWRAITLLPVDYDEDDYLRAAQQYAALIRSGDWAGFTQINYRPEHPPLAKIIFGISILPAPEAALIPDRSSSADPDQTLPKNLLRDARTSSAVLGSLEVLLVALVNPLAGLFLAIHAFTIKYTSQVMLEAVPALTSLAAILCYIRAKQKKIKSGSLRGMNLWFVLSAVSLGLTAASKYIYCVAGIAILVDWLLWSMENKNLKRFLLQAFLWGLIAFIVFLLFDPYLWPSPIERLKSSVLFNTAYSTGTHVQEVGYPFWQPLVWLNTTPYAWHPQAFYFAIDPLITLVAVFGITSVWKKQRLYVIWLGIALFFLLIWPTKWPQYLLILTAPLSVAASEGLMNLTVRPLQKWQAERKTKNKRESQNRSGDTRRALPWLISGLIVFAILTLFPLLFQLGISLTDFSATSLRDGLNGGLWREIWGGLTGQIHAAVINLGSRSPQVHYIGPTLYKPVLSFLSSNGILIFDILWTILSVLLSTCLGLGVAMLLWQKGVRFGKFWQALFILPWAIPEMIGAMMWLNIFMHDWGWLSLAVQNYGPHFPFAFFIGWEQSTNLRLLIFLIPAVWYGFPFMMLASSVGLKTIPSEVLDAAAVDGASAWNSFRYVTWPLLLPLIIPAIIIRSIFAFNQFYLFQAFSFTNGTLATLSYNIFNPTAGTYGLRGGLFSISAVINILTVIILTGFAILFNRWSRSGEGVSYA